MIMERNFQPVIIFSFSKKECEAYALQVAKLDFNTGINVIIINKTITVAYAPARAKLSLGRAYNFSSEKYLLVFLLTLIAQILLR